MALLFSTSAFASTDREVERALRRAPKFTPKDFTQALKRLQRRGDASGVALASFLKAERDDKPWMKHRTVNERRYRLHFACNALSRLKTKVALSALEHWLGDREWIVRQSCTEAYALIAAAPPADLEAIKPLRRALHDPSHRGNFCGVRMAAARGLGKMNDAPSVKVMAKWLDSQDRCERRAAAHGLPYTRIDRRSHGLRFIERLEHASNKRDREAAAWALSEMGIEESRPVLLKIVALKKDPGGNIRAFCLRGLAKVGRSEDIPLLEAVIRTDPYDGVGVWAVEAKRAIEQIRANPRSDDTSIQ